MNEITISELLKIKFISEKKHFCHLLDPLYTEYRKLYYETNFINKSFFLDGKNKIYIPLTLNSEKNECSFYGEPIEIFSNDIISKIDYTKIKEYLTNFNCKKVFKFQIKNKKKLTQINHAYVDKIINSIDIDLTKTLDEIKSNFSSNTRNQIKKNYENVKFEIIDKGNYKKNEIFKMMHFHEKISKKKTRSDKTWLQNEKMILDNRGFIVKAIFGNKIISLSFFYFNNINCRYFSSIADREYFTKIRNIHHKSLWLAINYVKNKCKFLNIGNITLFNKDTISEKEKNIEKFKSKFKGIDTKFAIFKTFPEYDLYKNFTIDEN